MEEKSTEQSKSTGGEKLSLSTVKQLYGNTDLTGRLAVVVGGTSGIGKGIALRLAKANASVIVVGRNEANGNEVVNEMKSKASNADIPFRFVKCDAQELANVKEFSNNFMQEHQQLDFLVLTQGIASFLGRTETKEGLDQKLCLHFYSRMAFIKRLIEPLQKAPNAKVLSVLSGGAHFSYAQYLEDTELKENFTLVNVANAAGFYNDLVLDAFSRHYPSISFIHTNPGFVNTNWGTELPTLFKGLVRLVQPFGTSIEDNGEFMCAPLFDPAVSGGFYVRGQSAQRVGVTAAHNDEAVEFLWKHVNDVFGARDL